MIINNETDYSNERMYDSEYALLEYFIKYKHIITEISQIYVVDVSVSIEKEKSKPEKAINYKISKHYYC